MIRHPEVAAQRPSKDERALNHEPSPFEALRLRGSHLKVTVRGVQGTGFGLMRFPLPAPGDNRP